MVWPVSPVSIAATHSASDIAGSCSASAVPQPILREIRPGRGANSCLTPASTTDSASPCWRASTLTAAPPARKFSTICQVTSLGKAETPRAARP